MSFFVSKGVPGIGTAPRRISPSMAIHHSGTRGRITSTRSPRRMPLAAKKLAARRMCSAICAKVNFRCSCPCSSAHHSASAPGRSAAQRSKTSWEKLNSGGAESITAAIVQPN